MMVESVWRGASRWWFVGGLLVGGALMGTFLMIVGSGLFRWWIDPPFATTIVVLISGVVCLRELGVIQFRIPQNARQVPERIVRAGPRYGAFQFGAEMGTGSRTFMTNMVPHVVAAAILLLLEPSSAAAAGLAFGAGRALVPVARSTHEKRTDWTQMFDHRDSAFRVVFSLTLVVGSSVLACRALGLA